MAEDMQARRAAGRTPESQGVASTGLGGTEDRTTTRGRQSTSPWRGAPAGVCGAALAWACCAGAADAAIIAHWNMNAIDPANWPMAHASTGSGFVDLAALGTATGTLLGTTLGGIEGDAAGNALSVTGTAANGQAMYIDFDASEYRDLTLSFAVRRSSTGFSTNRVEWWDGLAWSIVGRFGASTTAWELQSFDFSSYDAMDARGAYFRIVVDGATSSSGSIRFDNIRFSGEALPAPGALALLGAAGLVARRRRR